MMTGTHKTRMRKSMSSLQDVPSLRKRPQMAKTSSQKQQSASFMLQTTQRLQEAPEFNIPGNPRNSPHQVLEEAKQYGSNESEPLSNLEDINLKFVEETEDRGGPHTTASAALREKSGEKKRLSQMKSQGSFVIPRKLVSLQFNL